MTILRSEGAGEVSSGLYDFPIDTSLRFQPDGTTDASIAADNPYLNATLSESNGTIWTFSCWVKLADLGTNRYLLEGHQDTSNYTYVYISNADQVYVYSATGAYVRLRMYTTSKLLDPNSWYNIVVKFNGTSGSQALKIYINGVDQALTVVNSFTAHQSLICNSNAHYIGNNYNYTRDMAGYMAEANLIDGSALDADSFGETKNGIWIPKDTSGLTFGDNGFRLEFKQTGTDGDANGIGADTSGSTNHFAVGDTDGLGASDVVPDSPTNNFATWNPLVNTGQTITFKEGNLNIAASSAFWSTGTWNQGTIGVLGGSNAKHYFEFTMENNTSGSYVIGVGRQNSSAIDTTHYTGGVVYYYNRCSSDSTNTVTSLSIAASLTIIRLAFDASNGKVWIGDNNGYFNSGDPANGTGEVGTISGYDGETLVAILNRSTNSGNQIVNFGQDSTFANRKTSGSATAADGNGIGDFYYTPPSGFLALCSANLPEPKIIDGSEHFNTVLYTGNAGTQSITGVGFSPDWLWVKNRAATYSHALVDSVRGATKSVASDLTAVERTSDITALDSDGFSLQFVTATGSYSENQGSQAYVAWNWLAGTTASGSESGNNPAFSSSSNADAGFSIVSYTGTGSAGTVSHGCGAKPTMIMIKNRDQTDNWAVYHVGTASDPETDYMILNTTAGAADSANWWNDTAPTDSVFTVGTDHSVNADGEKYIAYCFTSVEGFSKAGSYTGGGSTLPFVHTGFKPSFVLLKSITAGNNWSMYDNKRDTDNPVREYLIPNENSAAASTDTMDFVSNGFKVRNTGAYINSATVKYVYLAFAEQPFKFANAR